MRRPVLVALGLAAAVTLSACDSDRADQVAHRRSLYNEFKEFPGSVYLEQQVHEVSESGADEVEVVVVYRLPEGATASEVLGFFRQNLPNGWNEVSDQACARSAEGQVRASAPTAAGPGGEPIPAQEKPPANTVMKLDYELTVFKGEDLSDGVTFKLVRSGARDLLLRLEGAVFACQPAGVDQPPPTGIPSLEPPRQTIVPPGN